MRFRLRQVANPSAHAQTCDTVPEVLAPPQGAWSRYEGTLMLTRSDELELCAYVHEYGYMPSAAARVQLRVRPWTQPVRIVTLEPPQGPPPTVTVTLAGPDGAIVWYVLDAVNNSALCEARAMVARVAPNLTLAADDAWLNAMQLQARPHSDNPARIYRCSCLLANPGVALPNR